MKKVIICVLLIVSLLLVIAPAAQAYGLGVGGQVVLKDVLRGGFATSRLTVNNPNPFPVGVGAWLTGDIADWITLSPADLTLQPNEQNYVDVTIQPPPFVPNGVYTGQITFVTTTVAGGESGGGAGVVIAVGSAINAVIEISDQEIHSIFVSSVTAERTEECRPINIKVALQNKGNVDTIPSYSVSLYHNEKGFVKIESITTEAVRPTIQRTDTLALGYSTTGLGANWEQFLCLPAGDYTATLTATDQFGKEFYTGSVPVYILQKGAISLSGNLKDIKHKDTAKLGEPVKITGAFENTGVSTEQSKLKVEAYKGDRLVEIVTGEETLSDPGQITNVTAYFTPKELGEFQLKSSVNFGGKSTNFIESELAVELGLTIIIIIVAIPLAILLIAILIWLRMRRGY
ncbi:MAG: hypothetical protein PHC66_00215 [Candidatus Nanoarchaeia archaeon]|nr:hypothetical protein [Candidatus Nanoarchaeia archaeon]MDD5239627.1 hypothetical protein [Candidatus Nanoarchaeia archaeon]